MHIYESLCAIVSKKIVEHDKESIFFSRHQNQIETKQLLNISKIVYSYITSKAYIYAYT